MNALLFIRLSLVIAFVIVIDFILKLNRAMKIDRRVSRYSTNSIIDDDNSISDIIYRKYNRIIRKFRKNYCFVVDEAHNFGAEKLSKLLPKTARYSHCNPTGTHPRSSRPPDRISASTPALSGRRSR